MPVCTYSSSAKRLIQLCWQRCMPRWMYYNILQTCTSACQISETCQSGISSCRESAGAHAGRSPTRAPTRQAIAEAMKPLLICQKTFLNISSISPGVGSEFPACEIAPEGNVILCLPNTWPGPGSSHCGPELWSCDRTVCRSFRCQREQRRLFHTAFRRESCANTKLTMSANLASQRTAGYCTQQAGSSRSSGSIRCCTTRSDLNQRVLRRTNTQKVSRRFKGHRDVQKQTSSLPQLVHTYHSRDSVSPRSARVPPTSTVP